MGGLSARNRVKRAVVLFHLWLGISVGALWALQGLSGALLVLHRDLDRPTMVSSSKRLPLDALIAAARTKAGGEAESIGLYYPNPAILGVTFSGFRSGKGSVLMEAATGRVMATRERMPLRPDEGNFWRWIYNFHHSLFAHDFGEAFLGISGLLLVSMAGTGAWLAWPRRGQWRASFAMRRWRTRSQQLFGWHRCAGLASALAIVVLALSGASMDFGKSLRTWAEENAGYRAPFRAASVAELPKQLYGTENAYSRAREVFPRATLSAVTLPTPEAPVYQVRVRQPGEWRQWSGTSMVVIHAASGRVLSSYDAARGPIANRILDSAFPVHNGEIAGLPGRILVLLAGLSLPVLYMSGLWAWLRRRRATGPSIRSAHSAKRV